MSKSKPDEAVKMDTSSADGAVDVGGPPVLSPESEFEKLLQEETARFHLPLALRKSPRSTAGMSMKYTNIHDDDMDHEVIFNKPMPKPSKEIKFGTKRKLDLTSPSGNYIKSKHHKDKHKKEKHKHKHKESESVEDYIPPSSKKPKIGALKDQDSRNDFYCWYCHKEGSVICCEICPRVYHTRCLKYDTEPDGDWVCPVCQKILESECVDTQSEAMSKLSVSQLSRLLTFSLKRMKHQGTDSFQKPVSLKQFPDYASYIFYPMDLGTLEQNIKKNQYGSTYAFLEEVKWILHNCIIFNGSHHKLTNRAKSIVKICDYEMNEIEICPNCYLSSCLKRDNWFCEPCDPPHIIVWAKLQGFPYWQSKVLRESKGQVDVRFFGQHDRAWIPMSNCFLISKNPPTTTKKQLARLATANKELKVYGENIRTKYGDFVYHPPKTPYRAGMSVQSKTVDSSSPAIQTKSPAKPVKPLSGKPAAFMNGIREAEAAERKEEEEEEDVSGDESVSGLFGEKTRQALDTSIDENSMDSVSQESSSVCSMESSQTDDKTEVAPVEKVVSVKKEVDSSSTQKSRMGGGATRDKVADCNTSRMGGGSTREKIADCNTSRMGGGSTKVADCNASRMGGMKVTVKKLNAKTTNDGTTALSPKTAEFVKKKIGQDDGSPKRPAPTGVFEITDRSLDLDQEKESPSVQLLAKPHVSPKRLSMSPGKSSPKKSANESSVKDSSKNRPDDNVVKEQSAISKDPRSIILPSKLPDPSALDKADLPPKTPESGTPSSSTQGTPKSSDKFHMKLSKTIETMKATLGVESMDTHEHSESDSESEVASTHENDSDTSAEQSDEETGAINEEKSGAKIEEKSGAKIEEKSGAKIEEKSGAKIGENSPPEKVLTGGSSDPAADVKDGESQASQPDDKATAKDQESDVASECGGLAMSCHSADDQSENELVIDMDRIDGQSTSKENNSDMNSKNESESIKTGATEIENDKSNVNESTEKENEGATQDEALTSEMRTDLDKLTVKISNTPSMPKLNISPNLQLQMSKGGENKMPSDSITVTSPSTTSLASQMLTEIVHQKEVDEKKQSQPEMMDTSETKRNDTIKDEDTVGVKKDGPVDVVSSDKKDETADVVLDDDKKDEDKTEGVMDVDLNLDDYPFEEEDPLKAWGTADDLLDKYASKVSQAVKESLTSARRDFIDSVTKVNVKTKMEKLQSQVSRLTWEKEKQKQEMQHIMELTIAEMRDSLNADLKKCEMNTKKEAQKEKEDAVRELKKKQWCAQCEQEAFFYCCWNTSYCSYTCQQKHWTSHQNTCQQSSSPKETTQSTSQSTLANPNTITIAGSTATIAQGVNTTNNNPTIRVISSTQRPQNQPLQIVQTAPSVVTAAQNSSNPTPSVQTLIRYMQAPPRMPMQTRFAQPGNAVTIRLPISSTGGPQLLPAIRQIGGDGQPQRLVFTTSQPLQNLKPKSATNIYNV